MERVLDRLEAQEREGEGDGDAEAADGGARLVVPERGCGRGHGEAARDQDDGHRGPERKVRVPRRRAERLGVRDPIRGVEREERGEEERLAPDEDPHPEPGRVRLLGQVLEVGPEPGRHGQASVWTTG